MPSRNQESSPGSQTGLWGANGPLATILLPPELGDASYKILPLQNISVPIALSLAAKRLVGAYFVVPLLVGLLIAGYFWLLLSICGSSSAFRSFDLVKLMFVLVTLAPIGAVVGMVLNMTSSLRINSIRLSSGAIELPETYMLSMKMRTKRKWNELTVMTTMEESGENAKQKSSRLVFSDGSVCTIPHEHLLPEHLSILEEYATKYALVNVSDRSDRPSALLTEQVLSYTRLWEESARFRSSVFVPLIPGAKINQDRVDILRLLHTSAMAATYLGRLDNERLVVVKEAVVPISSSDGERARELFQRECGHLLKLDHPQIVKVIDHVVENERDYLILEWISGEDLRNYTRKNGPAHEKLALSWLLQISRILKYLHDREPALIHRDVSPENLMLTPNGNIVLIDFGAANYFVENATGTMIGKHGYVAPEQLYGKAEPVSDLYGLGATMYFVLTGTEPTALTETPDIKTVSDETGQLLKRLTRLDASERIPSASAVATAVEEIIAKKWKQS